MPQTTPPARPAKQKGGPIALPLAIVAVAAVVSIGIVVLANRPPRDDETHHDDSSPAPQVRRPRTVDVAEIRRILVEAGYALSVDALSENGVHTFAPIKLPCAGSVVVMPMQSEAMARSAAEMMMSGTSGAVPLVEGPICVSVAITLGYGSDVDAACTDEVVALLAR